MTHLIEVPVEAILVVGNSGDEGQHQAPAAPHLTVPSPVLSVLPEGAVVLLMHTHRFLDDHGLTCQHINTSGMGQLYRVIAMV